MPGALSRSSSAAPLTARAVPKCISSARLRLGPMPGTSSRRRRGQALRALGAVGADGEAVRLVAQPLEVEQQAPNWAEA